VRLALEYRARVILEDLSNFSALQTRSRAKGKRRNNFRRLLNRIQFEKLRTNLSYKLGEYGMKEPLLVRAPFTSRTCPECSHVAKENRARSCDRKFVCVSCGHSADADENAARVIAIKGQWLVSLSNKKGKGWKRVPDELKFDAFLRNCAAKRKRGPAAARPVLL
jgi:IS605 OrfB family transposase